MFALKLTAGRPWLPYALPLAAVGMLVTVLLDAGVAMVMTALIARRSPRRRRTGSGLELGAYVLFGGIAGIVAVRRGDRLAVFVQAGFAVFVVNALVVIDVRAARRPGRPGAAAAAGRVRGRRPAARPSRPSAAFAVLGIRVRDPDRRSSCWSSPTRRSRCSAGCWSRRRARTTTR